MYYNVITSKLSLQTYYYIIYITHIVLLHSVFTMPPSTPLLEITS